MFTIRADQLTAFRARSLDDFRERMVEHVHQFFPDHCAALGADGVRSSIDTGIEQAARYQIVSERDVCKYITLMFAFGVGFAADPGLPWAAEILQNQVYQNGTDRIDALYATAKKQLGHAARRARRAQQ